MYDQTNLIQGYNPYFAEKSIVIADNLILQYTLSNSLEDIEIAILERTRQKLKLENASWQIDSYLNNNVKDLMNKHQVIYSMTTYVESGINYIYIHMHASDKWFSTIYCERSGGKLYCWNYFLTYSKLDEIMKKYYLDNKDTTL